MLSPLPRRSDWAYGFAHSPNRVSLPRYGSRVDLRIVLFEACSAFTRVTACTLALSPIRDTLIRRLQPLRFLHSCSGCFRLERSPGGACTHWKSAALSRRTPEPVVAPYSSKRSLAWRLLKDLIHAQQQLSRNREPNHFRGLHVDTESRRGAARAGIRPARAT